MKKLFGGKSKNRANGSSRDLSAEETTSAATVSTPIHAKLATTTPPATGVKGATLTKPSPSQKAQQQLELEQQKAQLAIQQQQQQLLAQQQAQQQQQVRRPSPPQDPFPTGGTPPNDDPERWEVVSTSQVPNSNLPTPLESPTYRSQGPAPHTIPVSRSSSYSSIPPPPSIPAAQGQRPASPATSVGMRHNAQRPGATTAVVLNNLAALGPAQPKRPQQAPAVLNHLKSLEPPRPGAEYPGSRYTDYSDRQSVSDHNQSQPALPPPEKEPKRRFWMSKDKVKDVLPRENFSRQDSAPGKAVSSHGHGAVGHAQHPSHPGVFGQPGQGVEEPPNDLTRRIGEPDPPSPPHHAHSHHFPHHFASHAQNSPQTTDARDPRRPPNTTPAPAQPVMTFTPHNITETIGYLTATASEDFALVYDVCDRASANEANAKEAVRALRREFKYGEPPAQLSAARLWAIMLHNSSPIFVVQSRSRKFMDTIEDILTSPRTNPVVKERLLDVVGAAAYATRHHSKQDGFQALWRKVKPHDKPDEGVPFDTEDAMFNPAPSSRLSQYEVPYSASAQPSPGFQQQQATAPPPIQTGPRERSDREGRDENRDRRGDRERERERTEGPRRRKSPTRNRIIPLEEDIRRLMQECKIGIGNANLLCETLRSCAPEDVTGNEIIEEFTMKCRSSQELIFAQIPWATAQAERSRVARDSEHEARSRTETNYKRPKADADETLEEKLLSRLLSSNAELVEALKEYDDLLRIAEERRAEEISRQETRMTPRELALAAQEAYSANGARGELYSDGRLGASRPSIDRSRSPTPSVRSYESRDKGSTFSHQALPQGPRDPHYRQSPPHQHRDAYQQHQEYEGTNLAPPPHVPHGPRSPGQFSVRTRSPSPGHGSLLEQQQHAMYQMQGQQGQLRPDQSGYQQQQQHAGIASPNTATPATATPNGLHGYVADGGAYGGAAGYGHHPQQHVQRDDGSAYRYRAYGHDDAGSLYGGVGSANGHAVRHGYDEDDHDGLEYEDGTPIRPSAKALGKRKIIEPEPTESPHTSDPEENNQDLDAIDNISDMDAESLLELTNRADNEGGLASPTTGPGVPKPMWPGQKPVQYVYDAAAERTAQRLAEAQRMLDQGLQLNGVVH